MQSKASVKVLYEGILTEFHNPSQIKISAEEVYDYAISAGAKFVRLRYRGSVPCHVSGFQSGVLMLTKSRDGAVKLNWGGKQEANGNVCKTGRLYFKPDKLGILWAEVPKFPANMKLLAACHINDSREWDYTNAEDEREIAELAERFASDEDPDKRWKRDKIEKKTSRSFRKVAQEAEKKQEAAKQERAPEEQAESSTTDISAPVASRRRGAPILKPEG